MTSRKEAETETLSVRCTVCGNYPGNPSCDRWECAWPAVSAVQPLRIAPFRDFFNAACSALASIAIVVFIGCICLAMGGR